MHDSAVIVPIKTTNERLPGKNTRELRGVPLYAYLFSTLRSIGMLSGQIFVDSSSPEILAIAQEWGFVGLERPKALDEGHVTGDELLARTLPMITVDRVALLHVTTPFLTAETIMRGFETLRSDFDIDSAMGMVPHKNRFWFSGRPVNHDPNALVPTQLLKPVHEEADIYFFRKSSFEKYGKRVCGKRRHFSVERAEALDIDTLTDFVMAEALLDAGVVRPTLFEDLV